MVFLEYFESKGSCKVLFFSTTKKFDLGIKELSFWLFEQFIFIELILFSSPYTLLAVQRTKQLERNKGVKKIKIFFSIHK
ncbi:hypothetical protein [Clostridium haemolyticum]|uniref:hypothetical protein n=1 Tax=Clostridium haemolyticum TaxID=84025 RepID=UPI001FA8CF20|nr:hypothetical protein [Clostridium haemolyticum]